MANQDYYSDVPPAAEAPPAETPPEAPPVEETPEEGGAPTFTVPKTALTGDVQPGEEMTVRAVRVHENEVEFEVVGGELSEEAAPETPMAPPPGMGGGMAPMME